MTTVELLYEDVNYADVFGRLRKVNQELARTNTLFGRISKSSNISIGGDFAQAGKDAEILAEEIEKITKQLDSLSNASNQLKGLNEGLTLSADEATRAVAVINQLSSLRIGASDQVNALSQALGLSAQQAQLS